MFNRFTRRDSIKLGAGVGAATLLGSTSLMAQIPAADVAPPDLPIEDGASLTLLRPTKFVASDEEMFWLANTARLHRATGVPVKVEFEGWEDCRPRRPLPPMSAQGRT